jgi:topoisomerase-4 subunit A
MGEVPVMTRGKGVLLQKYKEPRTHLGDATTFKKSAGFSWTSGKRKFNSGAVSMWLGHRAAAGHMPPDGFPRSNKFNKE